MKRHLLNLSLIVFVIQFLACNPTNLWQNDDSSEDVSSVQATSNTQVEIIFGSDVEKSSAENAANYSIDNGLTVSSAVRDDADNAKVTLTTLSQQDIEYTLIVKNVKKTSGKKINTSKNPDKFMGDPLDTLLFTVTGVTWVSSTSITINFSNTVDEITGSDIVNYSIDPYLAVVSADVSDNTVTLVTDTQTTDVTYTVTVADVLDTEGNAIDLIQNTGTFVWNMLSVTGVTWISPTSITINFSKNVDETTGSEAANYQISSTLGIISIVSVAGNTVTLNTTDTQIEGETYTVTVTGVLDSDGNAIDSNYNTGTFTGDAYPAIVGANWEAKEDGGIGLSVNHFRVEFSEAVNETEAKNADNYTIYPALTINSISKVNDKVYELMTEEQTDGIDNYQLSVSNIHDLSGHNNVTDEYYSISFSGVDCPYIVNIEFVADLQNQIDVIFSENITQTTAENESYYIINGDNPSIATRFSVDHTKVRLGMSDNFNLNTEYTLTIYSIIDENYNNLICVPNTITFTTPDPWPCCP